MERPTIIAVGNRRRLECTFTDMRKVPTDPAVVVCQYQDPSGLEVTRTYGTDPEVIKESTGVYYLDLDIDTAGTWYYRFKGTGPVKAADERTIIARETVFA
jgi:hypothetical protein